MRVASVCSGIGAPEVAWTALGWKSIFMSEIEAFPREVLKARHGACDAREDVPAGAPLLFGDFTAISEASMKRHGRSFSDIDVLVGGTPCQSFSLAGLRGSLDDDRGNLALAFVRLANAIDAVRLHAGKPPVWTIWENVPGVLSTHDNAFGSILAGLVGGESALDPARAGGWTHAGVVSGPRRCAAWRILDAQHFGLAQRRRRVFVIARGYFGGAGRWDGSDALLPVVAGRDWHSAPRRSEGQDVAGTLAASSGGSDENDAADGRLIPVVVAMRGRDHGTTAELTGDVMTALRTGGGGGDKAHVLAPLAFHARQDPDSGPITHPLDTDGTSIAVLANWRVRRLTPTECEKLQGFPEDFTAITFKGKPAADGPRYRALGNSMAVPVLRWIGERVGAIHARHVPEHPHSPHATMTDHTMSQIGIA